MSPETVELTMITGANRHGSYANAELTDTLGPVATIVQLARVPEHASDHPEKLNPEKVVVLGTS